MIMFAFLVGLFLFALDNTIVADVQPAIVNDLQAVDKISWLATAFFLPPAGMLPLRDFSKASPRPADGTVFNDLPGEVVIHSHGDHLRSRECYLWGSAKYQCFNRWPCARWYWC